MNIPLHALAGLLLGSLLSLPTLALAQSQPADAAAVAPATAGAATADDSLYRALGEQPGLVRIVEDFVARNLGDTRTGGKFDGINLVNLKRHLVEQLCQVSGGPCPYTGDDMRVVHEGYDINKAQFNAVVENLQFAMQAQGVPFGVQNRLLARLAPMYRDVITVR